MVESWENALACATACLRCSKALRAEDPRILSIYDHQPICMACKQAEERRPDYAAVSKQMIAQCMIDTELAYSDPGGFCYHHFYPFTC